MRLSQKGMNINMNNQLVVITGGGGGLGAVLAKKYTEAGARLVLLDISSDNLLKVAQSLKGEIHTYPVDISVKEKVSDVFNLIYTEVGDIDVLINCAGVGRFDLAENISEQQVNAMIDINLKGTIFCTQEVLKPMKEKNHGHIVNVISMSGVRPVVTESVYCASKFGLSGFTRALALELENTAVRTLGIYMGNMATDLWKGDKPADFDKFIRPEDMADIIIENTKFRSYLSIEEIFVKNLRNNQG
ncbi:SDR family oxidoreductase [Bacillota bacterium]